MKVYGIPNCNTVKKAQDWLKANNIAYEFHDFKKLGVSESKLKEWTKFKPWETLLNKNGTTWKKLDLETQQKIITEQAAFSLMQQKTSSIKRPVIETDTGIIVGFDEQAYQQLLK